MALRLRWKVSGAYAALIVLLAAGLGIYVEHAAEARMTARLRASLLADCRLVRVVAERAGMPSADLPGTVHDLASAAGIRITLIRPDGHVVADSHGSPNRMELHDTRPEIVAARTTGVGWGIRHSATLNSDMLYVAETPGPDRLLVRTAVPLADVRQAALSMRHAIAAGAALGSLLAILAGFWLSGGLTRSLGELTAAATRIGAGDLATRVHVASGDETGQLARALNAMAADLAGARGNLEQTAARLRSILAQMADGIVVVAPDETVQVLNPAAGLLLDTDPAQALGKRLSEVVLNYDLTELTRRALRLRTLARGVLAAGTESPRSLAAAATPIESEEGQLAGAVVSLRDISELQRLQQVRQDFVANAGHELRTPVAAIRSLAETLAGGAINDPAAAPRFLSQIVTNTEDLARLLDDMMTLSRLDTAGTREGPRGVNVRAALERAVARLGPQADSKHTQVTVAAPEDLEAWCAEDNLMAALVNLIDNAIKYTPDGGTVEVAAEAVNGHVQLTVADDGPGIPEAHRQRIFERFYRLDKGRSRALGGTGLGLSIVKHAVESESGQVWVEGSATGGSRFVIILPAAPAGS